jgi:hypothetical protein
MTDEETKKRFANLAIVGDFLFEISNENVEATDYFLAKTALEEFGEAVAKVDLELPVRTGVENLIRYLDKKIEKRKRQQDGEFSQD